MKVNLIFSMTKKLAIGNDNHLLVRNKEDMKFFKEQTTGNVVIMGYNTFKSMNHRPLKDRINIVISTQTITSIYDNVYFVKSIDDANKLTETISNNNKCEVYIIGGASIYKQYLTTYSYMVNKVFVTIFNSNDDGDSYIDQDIYINNFGKKYIHIIKKLKDDAGTIYEYTNYESYNRINK